MIFCMGCSFERKKVIQLLMILYFDCKLNNLWVDKGNKFDNKSMKSWLQDKDIETYSVHNEEKSVFAERFIRTLKSKIYKYTTSILKSVNINKIDNLVDKYNNTYYRTIKISLLALRQIHTLILMLRIMMKILNLKLVAILKYQNTATLPIDKKKFLLLKKLNILYNGHM